MACTGTSSTGTWGKWVITYNATGAATDTTCTVWQDWNSTATDTTCTVSTVWVTWNEGSNVYATYQPPQRTPEELEADRVRREQEQVEYRRREAERIAAADAAERKASELLWNCLTAEQQAAFKAAKKFQVAGADGVKYEIDCTKRSHNVFTLNESGERVKSHCAYPNGSVPLADQALSQKLALETDVAMFHRIANVFDLIDRRQAV